MELALTKKGLSYWSAGLLFLSIALVNSVSMHQFFVYAALANREVLREGFRSKAFDCSSLLSIGTPLLPLWRPCSSGLTDSTISWSVYMPRVPSCPRPKPRQRLLRFISSTKHSRGHRISSPMGSPNAIKKRDHLFVEQAVRPMLSCLLSSS